MEQRNKRRRSKKPPKPPLFRRFQQSGPLQHVHNATLQFLARHPDRRLADDQNKIDMCLDPVGLQSDDFLGDTSHPVPHDGIADFLAGGHAQPERLRLRLPGPVEDELSVRERLSLPVDPAKIFPVSQPQFPLHGSSFTNLLALISSIACFRQPKRLVSSLMKVRFWTKCSLILYKKNRDHSNKIL